MTSSGTFPSRFSRILAVFGPGLVVMLADTEVGSIVTAGQSGVQWGYRMLLLQLLLMPVLYMVQELTVRLGIFTGRGHGELIKEHFGSFWAWVSVAGLGIATFGALLTEFSGVAGVGEMYGVTRGTSLLFTVAVLLVVVLTGSYRRVERVAMAFGLFELVFFFVAAAAHPSLSEMATESLQIPYANKDYLYLAAANIGAVIMPWMVFYQQSAVADKKLGPEHFAIARVDTILGSILTQLIMAAVLITCAATIGHQHTDAALSTVGDMSRALTPFLGDSVGRLVFGFGVLGAGLVAAIVVSLAFAWGVGEVTGYRHSLEDHPLKAHCFYGIYTVCVLSSALLVWGWPNLIALNIGVEVMNAMLLPLVLGFLILLAARTLPEAHRLKGAALVGAIFVAILTAGLGVFGGLQGAGLLSL